MDFLSFLSLMILNSAAQLLGSDTSVNASAKQFTTSTFAEIMFSFLINIFIHLCGLPLIFLSFSYIFAGRVLTFKDSRYYCISWHFDCLNVFVAIAQARLQLILSSFHPLYLHFLYFFPLSFHAFVHLKFLHGFGKYFLGLNLRILLSAAAYSRL